MTRWCRFLGLLMGLACAYWGLVSLPVTGWLLWEGRLDLAALVLASGAYARLEVRRADS